ncbi:MAG TPA: FecR domain-containing protein [Verrucomicrobiae bacterium]
MKQTQRLTNSLIASAIALAMISSLAAQTAMEGTAKVIRVKGPARYTTGNNVWLTLKPGAVLKPGTIVQTSTEQGSFVDLVLSDGGGAVAMPSPVKYTPYIPNSMSSAGATYAPSAEQNVVRIWENTALGIDKIACMRTGADEVSDIQLDLKAGHVTGNVKKMSAASKYEIKLPNGVAGIRGTTYDITSEGVVSVMVGSVVLAWVNPKTGEVTTQVVTGGNRYDARTAQMGPIPPTEMGYFSQLAAATQVTAGGEQTTFTPDKTVIFISPVTGGAANGSGGE